MMTNAKPIYSFEPNYAVPPGETLHEIMESLGMTQRELATRTELTVQTLIRIFKGEQPISYETANKLELVTNVPARIWNNLEAEYREQLVKKAERERLKDGLDWLKTIPTKKLIDRGEIEHHKDKISQLRETLAFYGVSSVESWSLLWEQPAVAARRSQCFDTRPGPASAWIRMGERQAQAIVCQDYDKAAFKTALNEIRSLTVEGPTVFEPRMKQLCADAGVAVALVPEFKGVPWNGATKWLSPNKAMILLSLRGKGEDRFWFSFFHEAGHVFFDNKKGLLISDGTSDDPREKRADKFASQMLIPDSWNSKISSAKSANEIILLAKELNLSAGIVAGRYQYLTQRWDYYNRLIKKLVWKPKVVS